MLDFVLLCTFCLLKILSFRGGAQVLTDYMTEYLLEDSHPQPLLLKTALKAIKPSVQGDTLDLTVTNGKILHFEHVISTIPMTCLRTLDIEDCLDYEQRNAVLRLQMESAVKVGIKFKSAWWKDLINGDGEKLDISGGQSYTDRTINNVIYPSSSSSTTLIAAYTASRNAALLGSLINSGEEADATLKDLILRDLAILHNVSISELQSQYITHFAFDWGHNPLSRGEHSTIFLSMFFSDREANVTGAFTSFGPGQLSTLYPALTRPGAGGRLHFAGEASSIRHA